MLISALYLRYIMSISSISDVYLRYITRITTNIARIRRGAGRWVADKYHNAYRGRRTYHECICNISAESIMGSCITDENVYHNVSRRITYVSHVSIMMCIITVSSCISVYHVRCIAARISRTWRDRGGPGDTQQRIGRRALTYHGNIGRVYHEARVSVYQRVSRQKIMYHHDTRDICVIPSTG